MDISRAAVVSGFRQNLTIEDVPIPDLNKGDVLVRVEAATLCGTDLHFWQSGQSAWLPYVPGHETCGTIAAHNGPVFDVIGDPLEVGDRIIASYSMCGHCYWCTTAMQAQCCPEMIAYGRVPVNRWPYLLGGCAEFHFFPHGAGLVRVPEVLSSPLAASGACALRTVMHGFERLGTVASHETVVVQGAGPVGLYATAVARDRGAAQVFTVGAPAGRLQIAKEFGANDVLDLDDVPDPDARREWVLERTHGRGADVVIECAGQAAIPESYGMLRRGGRVLVIGVDIGGKPLLSIPSNAFADKYSTTYGIAAAESRHFYQAIRFLESRFAQYPFERMLTGSYDLNGVTDAFHAMEELREIKPVVVPSLVDAST
jgi:L-iditol 2-dehydrogenase